MSNLVNPADDVVRRAEPEFGPEPTKAVDRPSILHVGGVGTNALINSGLLDERGYQSHVAANDIYHCICSPEWTALANAGLRREDLGDDFFPNFFRFAEAAAVRPRWFAQGPQLLTIMYLYHLKRGDIAASDQLWRTLEYNRFKAVLRQTTVPAGVRLDEGTFAKALKDLAVAPVYETSLTQAFTADRLVHRFTEVAARLNGDMDPANLHAPFHPSYVDAISAADERLAEAVQASRTAGHSTTIGLELPTWALPPPRQWRDDRRPANVELRRQSVQAEAAALFDSVMPAWNNLFALYDHRMMYGGSAVLGFLSDSADYMAYEHGTIRSIPFEDNPIGQLTRAAFVHADAVFITNTDYITATRRLEFDQDKRVYVPHAFDERLLLDFAARHRPAKRSPGPIRLFAPARQDWVLNDPARSKANHLIVEAAALLVASGSKNFKITFAAWGDDVEATKTLIAERGVTQHFDWTEPLARNALWQRYLNSDAVLDQFLISGLSGVTYETLTIGCRTITRDDGICNKEFFGVPPPFMAANSAAEIAERIQQLIDDPNDASAIGAACQAWVRAYHSGARFVALQEAQFHRIAAGRDAIEWLVDEPAALPTDAAVDADVHGEPAAETLSVRAGRLFGYARDLSSKAKTSALATVGIRSTKR
jgi:glycosyltransferase involved in cell wall biosynthesis